MKNRKDSTTCNRSKSKACLQRYETPLLFKCGSTCCYTNSLLAIVDVTPKLIANWRKLMQFAIRTKQAGDMLCSMKFWDRTVDWFDAKNNDSQELLQHAGSLDWEDNSWVILNNAIEIGPPSLLNQIEIVGSEFMGWADGNSDIVAGRIWLDDLTTMEEILLQRSLRH
ncbi:MAG: hypothetical protein KDB27_15800 [Planctomycetales bacterium]|nr:hypothetical protein [Planctomycetales bacterium]